MNSRPSTVGERTFKWLVAKAPVAAVVALSLVVSACGGGAEDARSKQSSASSGMKKTLAVSNTGTSAAVTTVSVEALTLKAERRLSRTVFEYDYQLTVKNNGAALSSVVVELASVGPGSTVIDGRAEVAQLAANATVIMTDMVTIRHDRRFSFDPSLLTWTFRQQAELINGVPVPPEPSAGLNNSTVAGVDSNSDGIRDDVERKIAQEFGAGAATQLQRVRAFASTFQRALVNPTAANIKVHIQIVECESSGLLARLNQTVLNTLNTPERGRAYARAFAGVMIGIGGCQ